MGENSSKDIAIMQKRKIFRKNPFKDIELLVDYIRKNTFRYQYGIKSEKRKIIFFFHPGKFFMLLQNKHELY